MAKRTDAVGIQKLAEDKIKDYFQRYDSNAQVEILSENRVKISVHEDCIASIIGRGGTNINEIEKLLKVHIDIVAKDSEILSLNSNDLAFSFSESKTALLLTVNREYTSMYADIYTNDEFFASVRIGKKGQIKIPKRSDIGQNLLNSTNSKNDIRLFLKDF